MSTKSNRSSGTQHNARGVTQGTTLVDPKTGLPIDTVTDTNGIKRLAVDGNFVAQNVQAFVELEYTEDSVAIGDEVSGNKLKIEPDGSINANIEVDASDGDNIAIHDSDGDELQINPDGSINNLRLNSLFDIKYDDIEITSKNTDGNPLIVVARLLGSPVRTLTLTYDSDGDFQRVQKS